MKKKIILLIAIISVIACAFWAKGYYNNRYVVSDNFYTQIPEDEVNEDSWLLNKDGVKQEKGKEYKLIGYNKQGDKREVSFIKKGNANDYYKSGTYIKVNTSKTLVIGIEVLSEADIPETALENIKEYGTKIN